MADTLRDLVVSLSLDETNFTRNLKSVKVLMQQAASEFALASAGIDGFEDSMSGMSAIMSSLQQKLGLQRDAYAQYAGILDNARAHLENHQASLARTQSRLSALTPAIATARDEQQRMAEVLEATVRAFGEESEDAAIIRAEYEETVTVLASLEKEYEKTEGQLKAQHKSVQNWGDAVNKATTDLNNAEAAIRTTEANIQTLGAAIAAQNNKWTQLSQHLQDVGSSMSSFGDSIANVARAWNNYLTQPIKEFGEDAIDAATSFETAFTTVRQVTNATEQEYAQWTKTIKTMSTEVGVSASTIANTMAEAGRLGVQNGDIENFTRTAINLGQAFNMSATDAATSAARFFNIMGTTQDRISNFGSSVTYLANNYATTADEIMSMAKGLAGTGKIVGMSEQDILGIATALTSLGIESGRGATTFSKALMAMETSVATNDKYLKDFANVCGMTAEQFKQAWNEDATGTFQKFILGLGQLEEEGMSSIAALQDTGISSMRLVDTLLRSASAVDMVNNAVSDANTAWNANTEIATVTEERYATTAIQIENLKNNFDNLKALIGEDLKPAFESLLEAGNNLINGFASWSPGLRSLVETIAAVVAGIGVLLSAVSVGAKVIGSITSTIGRVIPVIQSMAASGALATMGWVALGAAVVAATVAFIDWVSGAKAARDAAQDLRDTVADITSSGVRGIYDSANNNMLAAFGLTEQSFVAAEGQSQSWFDKVIEIWTDGKSETTAIIKSLTDEFKAGSDDVRDTIEDQKSLLSGLGVLDDDTLAGMEADMKQLDAIDKDVASLLRKKRNGVLSDEEKAKLQELIAARDELAAKWGVAADLGGYDSIQAQLDADIAKAEQLGMVLDSGRYGEALVAISQGYKATQSAIDSEYDKQYQKIMQIQDETLRNAALEKLNAQYAADRAKAQEEYKKQLAETAAKTAKDTGVKTSIDDITKLKQALESIRTSTDDPAAAQIKSITDWASALGSEGVSQLQSLYSMIMQLKGAGMGDDEIETALGLDAGQVDGILGTLNTIKEVASGDTSGALSGLSDLIKTLDENAGDVLTVTLGIDSEAAKTEIETFMSDYKNMSVDVTTALTNLTSDQITEWNNAHKDVKLNGGMATVQAVLGDGAAEAIQKAFNDDALVVYGADGMPIKVTLEDLPRITAADVCAYDEDGTLHVLLTPEITTPEYADEVLESGAVNENGNTNIFGTQVSTAEDKIDGLIESANAYVEAQNKLAEASDAAANVDENDGAAVQATGTAALQAASEFDTASTQLKDSINGLSDIDISTISRKIETLKTVLGNSEGKDIDPSEIEQYKSELESLQAVLDLIRGFDKSGATVADTVDKQVGEFDTTGKLTADAGSLTGKIRDALTLSNEYNAAAEKYLEIQQKLAASTDPDETNALAAESAAAATEVDTALTRLGIASTQISDADLDGAAKQIMALIGVLSNTDDLSPEQQAAYLAQLEELLNFADAMNVVDDGEYVSAGIAEGMTKYGWTGDASTLATNIKGAVEKALDINSPSVLMKPVGGYVSAGIGEGMTDYSFSTDASSVAQKLTTAMAAGAAKEIDSIKSIGKFMARGIAAGISSDASKVKTALVNAVKDAITAAKEEADINSPSRVMRDEVGVMLMKGMGIGISREAKQVATAMSNATRYIMDGPSGMASGTYNNQRTYNQQSTVNITLDGLSVRSDADVNNLAVEIAALSRRRNALKGSY